MAHQSLTSEQIISILKSIGIELPKSDLDHLLNNTQSSNQSPFDSKGHSIDSSTVLQCPSPCQNCCNENRSLGIRFHLDQLTTEVQLAVQHLKQTDRSYRHLQQDNLRSAALRVSYHSEILLAVLKKVLPHLLNAYEDEQQNEFPYNKG